MGNNGEEDGEKTADCLLTGTRAHGTYVLVGRTCSPCMRHRNAYRQENDRTRFLVCFLVGVREEL